MDKSSDRSVWLSGASYLSSPFLSVRPSAQRYAIRAIAAAVRDRIDQLDRYRPVRVALEEHPYPVNAAPAQCRLEAYDSSFDERAHALAPAVFVEDDHVAVALDVDLAGATELHVLEETFQVEIRGNRKQLDECMDTRTRLGFHHPVASVVGQSVDAVVRPASDLVLKVPDRLLNPIVFHCWYALPL